MSFEFTATLREAHDYDMVALSGQSELTKRLILPQLDHILERVRTFRAEVDESFQGKVERARSRPNNRAKGDRQLANYPVGHCREIRTAVLARMTADPFFQELVMQGIRMRPVFIFLQKQYFQNAIQLGNYYLDPANDTVVPEKPKLDWAPVNEVDYENVDNWDSFAEVAEKYLEVKLYPNLVFPLAFPAVPFFAIQSNGRLDLLLAQNQIFLKDLSDSMQRTRTLIDQSKWMKRRLPEFYEAELKRQFGGNLFQSFPLEYSPSTPKEIKQTILPEFSGLMQQPPKQSLQTLNAYFDIIQAAVERLHLLDIRPDKTKA